ncbi:MAG: tRNA (guanine37-N1)-methyltransferase [Gammaproteobacteria bacterium]|jgi:tRNA (guanine37-N1)-methyltransferase
MDIGIVTLFPEMFATLQAGGITARAIERGLVSVTCWNPRDYSANRHRTVDDRPYGGGPGMVLQVEPVRAAIVAARAGTPGAGVIHMSPQGRRLDQAHARMLAKRDALILLCGRYEGIDERLIALEVDEELSVGDYVLSGGELPAMVVVDAITRLLPDALGHGDSALEDSFESGLLDHPHYTRPEHVDGVSVPDVLLSGDHAAVERWRAKESLWRTWRRRPDLLDGLDLSDGQLALLEQFRRGERDG